MEQAAIYYYKIVENDKGMRRIKFVYVTDHGEVEVATAHGRQVFENFFKFCGAEELEDGVNIYSVRNELRQLLKK